MMAAHLCQRCVEAPVLPRRLAPGSVMVVCTPSGPGAPVAPRRFSRGLTWLRENGFEARAGAQVSATGYAAGSAQDRAAELNEALRDPQVRGLVAAIGGYNANGVLPHIDYSALCRDPKILLGYSDVTALLLAVYAQTGVVTFHGPTLMPELAEFPHPLPYTAAGLFTVTTEAAPCGRLSPPEEWTEEFLEWDKDDSRPRQLSPHPGWRWLAAGDASGRLVGGNLDTICVLVGTPYLPCLRGAVLFWETCADSLALVDRALTQLDSAGLTAELVGMVVGRSFRGGADFERQLQAHVQQRYASAGYPILAGVDLGHTDPMLTLPIGANCVLAASEQRFEVIDAAVR